MTQKGARGRVPTKDTIYRIASVSKVFAVSEPAKNVTIPPPHAVSHSRSTLGSLRYALYCIQEHIYFDYGNNMHDRYPSLLHIYYLISMVLPYNYLNKDCINMSSGRNYKNCRTHLYMCAYMTPTLGVDGIPAV